MNLLSQGMRIIKDSLHNYASDNCLALSASISFYAMFSFFPLLLLTLSIFATVVGSSDIAMARMTNIVSSITPVGVTIVMGWVRSIAQTKPLAWGIGIIGLIWGARHVFHTLALSASIIWGRKGWRDVILRQLVSLVLVGFAALVLLASIFLPGVIENLRAETGLAVGNALVMSMAFVPYAFAFMTFLAIYLLTSPRNVPRKNVLVGAGVVAITWGIAKNVFLTYIHMTRITSAYGSIGAIIVLMAWIYCSSAIVLWGMELVAATVEKPKKMSHIMGKKPALVIE